MVDDLRHRFREHNDTIYEADCFEHYGLKSWGVRAQFFSEKADGVISMMNYHSLIKTQAECETVAERLNAE